MSKEIVKLTVEHTLLGPDLREMSLELLLARLAGLLAVLGLVARRPHAHRRCRAGQRLHYIPAIDQQTELGRDELWTIDGIPKWSVQLLGLAPWQPNLECR